MQMHHSRARTALGTLVTILAAGAILAAQASGHARVYPGVVEAESSNAYTLVVPNESASATIESVEITLPEGFAIGGFEAAPGWTREEETSGSGEEETTTKVTWSGGATPTGEAAYFRFTGRPAGDHRAAEDEGADHPDAYEFAVTETYSDGEVADWNGAQDSDSPAPVVRIVDSFGGGGDSAAATDDGDGDDQDRLGVIALILAVLALLLSIAGFVRRGGRSLT